MLMLKKRLLFSLLFLALPWFAGIDRCSPNPALYSVGGNLSGIDGTIVLQNNGTNNLSLTSDGAFVFTDSLGDGSAYSVSILTQPSDQICTIANASGTMSGANVTNIEVTCAEDAFTVGGTLSGLSGTVVLQNNGGDNLSLSADGSFTFGSALADGANYAVTVLTQPAGQTCTVVNASGSLSGANVTNVEVSCAQNSYSIGGTVTGLFTGFEMELYNDGGDPLTVSGTSDGNATFTFSTPLTEGSSYVVTVNSAPQNCSVTNGSGNVGDSNVSDVTINCSHGMLFVTTDPFNGNLGGINGADAICAADSQCPSGFQCQAVLAADSGPQRTACTTANCSGGPSEHVDWVLLPLTAYTRIDGSTVVGITTENAIFDFNLLTGVSASSQTVWSGVWPDWTNNFFKCFQWTIAGSNQGNTGDAGAVDTNFLDDGVHPACTNTYPIVCVAHEGS